MPWEFDYYIMDSLENCRMVEIHLKMSHCNFLDNKINFLMFSNFTFQIFEFGSSETFLVIFKHLQR